MIEISIRLTPADQAAFNYAHWKASFNRHARTDYYVRAFFTGFLPAMMVLAIGSAFLKKPVAWYVLAITVIIGIVVVLYANANLMQRLNKGATRLPTEPTVLDDFESVQISIGKEFVVVSDEVSTVKTKWRGAVRALITKDYFFLYLNSQQAITIPKKDLSTDDHSLLSDLIRENISKNCVFVN